MARKPTHPPKEQLFLHRPAKGRVKIPYKPPHLQLRGVQPPFDRGRVNKSIQIPSGLRVNNQINHQIPSGRQSHAPLRVIKGPAEGAVKVPVKRVQASAATPQRFDAVSHEEHGGSELGHRKAMPGQHVLSQARKFMVFGINIRSFVVPTILILVMVVVICAFWFVEDDAASNESHGDNRKLTVDSTRSSVDPAPCCADSVDSSAGAVQAVGRAANTKANLLQLENSPGSWAKTYKKSDESGKEALELLFRCHIIPVREFAESHVSHEHIGECVWISGQMLREKSLDEWVEEWPHAMKTFEESVTACFAARTDVISSLYGHSRPNSPATPRSDMGLMDCHESRSISAPRSSSALRHHQRSATSTGKSPPKEQTVPSLPVLPSVQARVSPSGLTRLSASARIARPEPETESQVVVQPPRQSASTDSRSSVVTRCREIMSMIPTQASLQEQNVASSSSNPSLEHDAGQVESEPPAVSRDLSSSSIPPLVPLGRLDSVPPSEVSWRSPGGLRSTLSMRTITVDVGTRVYQYSPQLSPQPEPVVSPQLSCRTAPDPHRAWTPVQEYGTYSAPGNFGVGAMPNSAPVLSATAPSGTPPSTSGSMPGSSSVPLGLFRNDQGGS